MATVSVVETRSPLTSPLFESGKQSWENDDIDWFPRAAMIRQFSTGYSVSLAYWMLTLLGVVLWSGSLW